MERRVTTRWLEWSSVGRAKVEVMQKEVRGATISARPGGDTHMSDGDTTEQVLYAEKCSSGRSDDKRDTNFLKLSEVSDSHCKSLGQHSSIPMNSYSLSVPRCQFSLGLKPDLVCNLLRSLSLLLEQTFPFYPSLK